MAPLNKQDIHTRLQAVFIEVFDDEQLPFADALDRESLEAWDSLGHIRLVSAIEEAFDVTFTLDEIETMTSVAQIVAALAGK
jgi:acyl carrier protein